MRSCIQKGILTFLVGALFLAPAVSHGATTANRSLSHAELLFYIELLQQQIAQLQEELDRRKAEQDDDEREDTNSRDLEALETGFDYDFVAQYRVVDEAELTRVDKRRINDLHEDVWDIFVDIATPDFINEYVDQYLVYDEPKGSIAAFVETRGDASSWTIGVDISDVNLRSSRSRNELIETFVHEYAHLLTLNGTELNFSRSRRACNAYAERIGCFKRSAYLAEFVDQFWDDDDLEHADDVREEDDIEDALDRAEDYYDDNPGDFVTEYAAVSPSEDLAESFTFFVFDDKPTGDRKERDQKVLFFYEYDEMKDIRERILKKLPDIL